MEVFEIYVIFRGKDRHNHLENPQKEKGQNMLKIFISPLPHDTKNYFKNSHKKFDLWQKKVSH